MRAELPCSSVSLGPRDSIKPSSQVDDYQSFIGYKEAWGYVQPERYLLAYSEQSHGMEEEELYNRLSTCRSYLPAAQNPRTYEVHGTVPLSLFISYIPDDCTYFQRTYISGT